MSKDIRIMIKVSSPISDGVVVPSRSAPADR
jgi:hypothetical protein